MAKLSQSSLSHLRGCASMLKLLDDQEFGEDNRKILRDFGHLAVMYARLKSISDKTWRSRYTAGMRARLKRIASDLEYLVAFFKKVGAEEPILLMRIMSKEDIVTLYGSKGAKLAYMTDVLSLMRRDDETGQK